MKDNKAEAVRAVRDLLEYCKETDYLRTPEMCDAFGRIIEKLQALAEWPGVVGTFKRLDHFPYELEEDTTSFLIACDEADEVDEGREGKHEKAEAIRLVGVLLKSAEYSHHLGTSWECGAFIKIIRLISSLVRYPVETVRAYDKPERYPEGFDGELRTGVIEYFEASHHREILPSSIIVELEAIKEIKDPTKRAKELTELLDSIDFETVGDHFDELADEVDEFGPEISETTKVVEHIRNLKLSGLE